MAPFLFFIILFYDTYFSILRVKKMSTYQFRLRTILESDAEPSSHKQPNFFFIEKPLEWTHLELNEVIIHLFIAESKSCSSFLS
jgi:hypothetical protein